MTKVGNRLFFIGRRFLSLFTLVHYSVDYFRADIADFRGYFG